MPCTLVLSTGITIEAVAVAGGMAGGLGHDLAPPDVGDLVLAASHVTDADPGPDLDPGLDPGMVLLGLLDVPGQDLTRSRGQSPAPVPDPLIRRRDPSQSPSRNRSRSQSPGLRRDLKANQDPRAGLTSERKVLWNALVAVLSEFAANSSCILIGETLHQYV